MARCGSTRGVTVCVLSSHPLVLSRIQKLLGQLGFEFQTKQLPRPALSGTKKTTVPRAHVYILDVEKPGPAAERQAASVLGYRPGARLLVMGQKFTPANSFPLLQLGVKGMLTYEAAEAQLPRAVKQVANGGYWVSRGMLHGFTASVVEKERSRQRAGAGQKRGWLPISGREQQVLDAVLKNLSNKEIANELKISERTVKFHVSNLLSKFGVQRRADLILLQFQGGKSSRGNLR